MSYQPNANKTIKRAGTVIIVERNLLLRTTAGLEPKVHGKWTIVDQRGLEVPII